MIMQRKAPGGWPGAGRMARRAALPFRLYDTTNFAKTQARPPAHLTGRELELWMTAEAARDGDRQKFWDLRRELLLEQSRRYQPAR